MDRKETVQEGRFEKARKLHKPLPIHLQIPDFERNSLEINLAKFPGEKTQNGGFGKTYPTTRSTARRTCRIVKIITNYRHRRECPAGSGAAALE